MDFVFLMTTASYFLFLYFKFKFATSLPLNSSSSNSFVGISLPDILQIISSLSSEESYMLYSQYQRHPQYPGVLKLFHQSLHLQVGHPSSDAPSVATRADSFFASSRIDFRRSSRLLDAIRLLIL